MASKTEDLTLVLVETRLGAIYLFPDVSREVIEQCLPKGSGLDPNMPTLVLANASGAAISIPVRIIKRLFVGELMWSGPPDSDV